MSFSFFRLALAGLIILSCGQAKADVRHFAQWLDSQILSHPAIIAVREAKLSALSDANALERPLFNPALATAFEKNGGDENFSFSLEQTLDWSDQIGSQQAQARWLRLRAENAQRARLAEQKALALKALVQFQAARQQAKFAQEQRLYLMDLLGLIKARQATGELGKADAELAVLDLSVRFKSLADAKAQLADAQATVWELLPNFKAQKSEDVAAYLDSFTLPKDEAWLDSTPAVAMAKARWQERLQMAETRKRAAAAKPTIGFSAGRDGGEDVVGVGISVPLLVRNDYGAEVKSAQHQALVAEALYHQQFLKQRYNWRAAKARFKGFRSSYQQWQELIEQQSDHGQLLSSLWRQGELATAAYLQALSTKAQSLSNGIALHRDSQLAQIDALLASGQLQVQGALQ